MKHFQELVDEYYEYLCERLEKEIDKEIIKRGYASKEWFQKFIFEEYLKERFRYHIKWN